MYTKRVLRIILSSPSDLNKERKTVTTVVDDINTFFKSLNIGIDVTLWETDVAPRTDLEPGQINIDKVFNYKAADLLIGLFYKKLGTPTLGAESGTVHEIDEAIKSFKERGTPEIKLYFKEVKSLSSINKIEALDDYKRVLEKKKEYIKLGGIVQEFSTTAEFEKQIRKHIMWFVLEKLNADEGEKALSHSDGKSDSRAIETFPTVTSVFSELEKYLKNRPVDSKPEQIYGFGMDMQVALPSLEHLIKSYAKNITFKILTIAPSTHSGKMAFNEGGNYDPDTLKSSISRLKKIRSTICSNGNRIIVKTTNNVCPFHGMVINKQLYTTWLTVSDKNVINSTRPFVNIQRGIQDYTDNLIDSFNSWFEYCWKISDTLFDSENNKPDEDGTCELCGKTTTDLVPVIIKDDMGTRHRKICNECFLSNKFTREKE